MPDAKVDIVIKGKLEKLLKQALQSPEIMQPIMEEWCGMYGTFIYERFDVMASGGSGPDPKDGRKMGPWDALAPSTIAAKGDDIILVDSELLWQSVRPGSGSHGVAQMVRPGYFQLQATFHEVLQYPDSDLTTEDVLGFHQQGGPNLPQRKIYAQPDPRTRKHMADVGRKMLVESINA